MRAITAMTIGSLLMLASGPASAGDSLAPSSPTEVGSRTVEASKPSFDPASRSTHYGPVKLTDIAPSSLTGRNLVEDGSARFSGPGSGNSGDGRFTECSVIHGCPKDDQGGGDGWENKDNPNPNWSLVKKVKGLVPAKDVPVGDGDGWNAPQKYIPPTAVIEPPATSVCDPKATNAAGACNAPPTGGSPLAPNQDIAANPENDMPRFSVCDPLATNAKDACV